MRCEPLLDPDAYLAKLKEAFRFRPDYVAEIARATDLGWYLVRFGDELNSNLHAKHTLWCIRTILIARSAERHDPVFAPHLLAERSGPDRWLDATFSPADIARGIVRKCVSCYASSWRMRRSSTPSTGWRIAAPS